MLGHNTQQATCNNVRWFANCEPLYASDKNYKHVGKPHKLGSMINKCQDCNAYEAQRVCAESRKRETPRAPLYGEQPKRKITMITMNAWAKRTEKLIKSGGERAVLYERMQRA